MNSDAAFRRKLTGTRIPALDGLRAVGVIAVMGFHFGVTPYLFGWMALNLFFVLSGFLITHLLLTEYEACGTISLRNFYTRRFLRIFPAYYAFLAVTFGLMPLLGQDLDGKLVLSSIFYFNNYVEAFGHYRRTLVSHSWSLAVEEQFYLLWPLLLIWLLRSSSRPFRVLPAMVGIIVGWRWFLSTKGQFGYIGFAFETHADYLMIGCLLALAERRRWFAGVARAVSASALAPLFTIAFAVALPSLLSELAMSSVGHTLVAATLGIFLLQCVAMSDHVGWHWLEWRPVRYLGVISYPLYLYHQLAGLLIRESLPVPWTIVLVVKVAVAFGLAVASYHLVERRFLKLKHRWAFEVPRPAAVLRRRAELAAGSSAWQ